jgi:hypothetical protein
MTTEMTEQRQFNDGDPGFIKSDSTITGLRLFQPRIAFEEDNGTTATGTTPAATETPVNQSTPEADKTAEKPVNQSSTEEIRNVDGLKKAYDAVKLELKELKSYKQQQDKVAQDAEAKRLADKGAFEALLPIKVKEAVDPVNQMLEAEKRKAEKLATENAKLKADYESLQSGYKTEKLKSLVNQSFTASGGDPDAVDLLWGAYGNKFTLTEDGKPVLQGSNQAISEYMKTLQGDSVGSRLFLAKQAEGTGTNPQNNAGKGGTGVQARIMTNAEANASRDPKLMEKINSGEVIIKG